MSSLGALSQAWTSAEASLPLGWQLSGLYRFDELWVGLAEGPEFDDYLSGSRPVCGTGSPQAERSAAGTQRLNDRMRVKLGSVGYLKAANAGYAIGLDEEGHRIEFLGDRHVIALAPIGEWLEIQDWQVLAVDDVMRLPLSRLALDERAEFLRSVLAQEGDS